MEKHYFWRVIFVLVILIIGSINCADNGSTGEKAHECDRVCITGSPPKTCYYDFFLEWYFSMSSACGDCPFVQTDCDNPQCVPADGQQRAIITTNRKSPGPSIRVCEGDIVKVRVQNRLDNGESTTIHWHGLHQRGTPFMDGTHLVTQCPINNFAKFTYEFEADTAGTYFWHSHTAYQRGDGLHGSFVIRSTQASDPHWGLYDHNCHSAHSECEHILLIAELLDVPAINRHNYLHYLQFNPTLPIAALINGRGSNIEYTSRDDPAVKAFTPKEVFEVEQGKRYRFRVINSAGMKCPFKVSVEGHTLLVIATDGRNVEPVTVGSFMVSPGERYDFILTADKAVSNYWVKIFGFVDCEANEVAGYAILRYQGAAVQEPTTDPSTDATGYLLNALSERMYKWKGTLGESLDIPVYTLNSVPSNDLTAQNPDTVYFIAMDYTLNDPTRYSKPFDPSTDQVHMQKGGLHPVFNNITFRLQSVPPLSQPDMFNYSEVCNKSSIDSKACLQKKCICTHMLKFPVGHVVEMVLLDEGSRFRTEHPIHIHGYHFWVLGSGKFGESTTTETVWKEYYAGNLIRKLVNPPLKDTITIPDGGYVIIRFVADNPGVWNFHCHFEPHNQRGQALLVQIGETSQFPPVPKGFPQCGDWTPQALSVQPPVEGAGVTYHVGTGLCIQFTLLSTLAYIFGVVLFT